MNKPDSDSRLKTTIDLDTPGRQVGDLMLRWSDNSNPLGYHPIPIISLKGGPGPTVLIVGGTHGDEFEGPAAIMRLADSLNADELNGQILLMPALNAPAFADSARVSPLDGGNLNRAFPGDRDGGPTDMIADYIERILMPRCDAVIDLHSGGKASVFAPAALVGPYEDPKKGESAQKLAEVFAGVFEEPLIWVLGQHNDNRSVNAAAARAGVPMIAAELSGGGAVDATVTDQTEAALRNCLIHLGLLPGDMPKTNPARRVQIASPLHSVFAPADGLFDRHTSAGSSARTGVFAGVLRFPMEPARAPMPLPFPTDGFVLAHGNRGLVKRGELLALVAQDLSDTPTSEGQ